MGKFSYKIQMDYHNAMREADRLENIAKKMEKTIQVDFTGCMGEISRDWRGETSNNYREKGYKVAEHMNIIARDLKETAEAVREIAENTYKTEQTAIELAKERTYH